MSILYSPSSHAQGTSSGFYFSDDINAPNDAFMISDSDHTAAINLPPGSTYSFSENGTLTTTAPSDSYLLISAQNAQLSEIDAAYSTAINAPITYMGTSFQADKDSQDLMTGVLLASAGSLPAGFEWYDASNNGVVMTYAQLQGLAGAILSRGQPLFTQKQIKKSAIRAATTVSDVQSIVWSTP